MSVLIVLMLNLYKDAKIISILGICERKSTFALYHKRHLWRNQGGALKQYGYRDGCRDEGRGNISSCIDNTGASFSASKALTPEKTSADLVVYGKVFTSDNYELAEAFAVKDGKYIFVGDRESAALFVEEGKTQVLDYSGKGLVMPFCGDGHAHYMVHGYGP